MKHKLALQNMQTIQEIEATKWETESLILREYQPDDWKEIFEYSSKEEFYRYLAIPKQTEETAKKFVDDMIDEKNAAERYRFEYVIISKSENKIVGGAGIKIDSFKHKQGSLGYSINPEYWGKGIATEAATLMLEFGFKELGLHRIWAICDPDHSASIRVLERLGMKYEGIMRADVLMRGEWKDSLLYAILEEEFKG